MKIVLDTTILVRAHEHSHGLARELLLNIVASKHTLLLSNEMLHELARVLRYPRLRAFYDLSEKLVFDYVNFPARMLGNCALESAGHCARPRRKRHHCYADCNNRRGGDTVHEGDDFFEKPASDYLSKLGIAVVDDIALMHRLRS